MKYDVFVSYRRSSFESANLIAEKLRSMGFSVFFDVESLRSGRFNEQLFNVIDNCNDFVLVLPPNALERCSNPEDWVRKEVVRAMMQGKNIVPVKLAGFEWPEPMPEQMEELSNYQAITAGETEFFDMSMKRLASFLKSKPHRNLRIFYKKLVATLIFLLIILAIAGGVLHHISKSLCDDVTSALSIGFSVVNTAQKTEARLKEAWLDFVRTSSMEQYRSDPKHREEFIAHITAIKGTMDAFGVTIPQPYEFNKLESLLLSLYNVSQQDINMFWPVFEAKLQDLNTIVANLTTVANGKRLSEELIESMDIFFELKSHQSNQLYYIYLELLSRFPDSATTAHLEAAPNWDMMPNHVGIDLDKDDYMNFINNEQKEILKLIDIQKKSVARMQGKTKAYEEQAKEKKNKSN